jgi:UDP:flavonoid glycosyltransferase YjiC (YdhE family)
MLMKLKNLLNLVLLSKVSAEVQLSAVEKPLHIAISVTLGSKSNVKYIFEITQLLSNKGHAISYLCTKITSKFSKGYNVNSTIVGDVKIDLSGVDMRPFTRKSESFSLGGLRNKLSEVYSESFANYEKFYKEQKPDLIICGFMSPSCIDSAAKFSIPLIIGYQSLSSAAKRPYLTTSNGFEPTTIENFSFWERFDHGVIDPVRSLIKNYGFLIGLKRVRKENGVPASLELVQFTHLGLNIANSYIGFENPRSLSSNLYPVGPILPDTIPNLGSDLQPFFDSHEKIVYIAFGSLIRFKKELITNMLEHFQRLLNDGWVDGIVWGGTANTKLEEFPDIYTVDNVKYSTKSILDGTNQQFKLLKWAPQYSILNHPHTKLFVTHGGLDSIYEAIQSGTPMLVIPYFADQPRNAILVKEHGIGDYIEWPVDGDDLINLKLVKLLDPSNVNLKAKLDQFQGISKLNSKRKLFAADLIETYAYSAKTCRLTEKPKSFEIPCEIKPFLPLDQQISYFKSNLIDVYLVAISLFLVTFGLIVKIISKVTSKLLIKSSKQKKD